MSNLEPVESIFERLARTELRREVFGASEIERWPNGTLTILVDAGLLERATPAKTIECQGCERNCFKPVTVRPAAGGRPASIFIACDEPEDIGRVRVQPTQLEQWQIADEMLARAIARLLGLTKPLHEDPTCRRWTLGSMEHQRMPVPVSLSIEGSVTLKLCDQDIPLARLLIAQGDKLAFDKDMLTRIIEISVACLGSASWREKNARDAANVRHNKAGGSRDKRRQIREAWATGKYSSRDRCAEEEARALGISPYTARKALINAPEPKKRS